MAKKPAAKSSSSQPTWLKPVLTHLGIILAFLAVVTMYFKPIVLDGKILYQHDIAQFAGMAKETQDFRAETGEEALWISSLFGGMPAYQTSIQFSGDLITKINKFLWFGIPRPANYIFLMFLGFFFLLRVLKVNPWIAGIGAAAFALSSYFFIIFGPGHTSKANAIAYMAPVIASVIYTFRGNWLLGGAMTAFFTALEVSTNHYQITYFLVLMLGMLGIAYFVDAVRNKTLADFGKAAGILIMAGLLGVGPNLGRFLTTLEYAEVSTRGASELTPLANEQAEPNGKKQSGLDYEYAMRWSYDMGETFTLLIPNFYGGASQSNFGENEVYDLLKRTAGNAQAKRLSENWPGYWGDQPGTSGPVYVGAIIFFLFVLGLFIVPGRIKWWLLSAALLGIVLSWGRHFFLTDLFWDYFPGYRKFRAPSMFLVITEVAMPFLGALALKELFSPREGVQRSWLQKQVLIAGGIVAGLAIVLALIGPAFMDFTNESIYNSDNQTFSRLTGAEAGSAQVNQFIDVTISDRQTLLRNDGLRSALFIVLAGGLLWLFMGDKIKNDKIIFIALAALILLDMIPINQRYLKINKDTTETERKYQARFNPTKADQFILQDQDPNYRVLNLSTNTFNDAATSYFHKHIGGYHAAKMQRYSEVILRHIQPEIQEMVQVANLPDSARGVGMSRLQVINMLNTRYMIFSPGDAQNPPQILQNPAAMGNAWLVSNIQFVDDADAEIAALNSFDPRRTAIVNQTIKDGAYKEQLAGVNPQPAPGDRIILTDFQPNKLTYQTSANQDQVAVFSEVYYNDGKGWNAYIDNEQVPHFNANYILRGLKIPAGEHTVEFRFEPSAFYTGNTLSLVFSILVILLLGGALFMTFRPKAE
ncbi:MAG: YfhO family protein [Bacteroidia bacterium]